MSKNIEGIIISGVGGLYSVKAANGEVYPCRAKGAFRKSGLSPLAGDSVVLRVPELAGEEYFIEQIMHRKNALIRPPMANLTTLFVTFAPKNPVPSTLYLDKLLSIAVFNHITPVVVITKQDIDASLAEHYAEIYRKAGFPVFISSSENGEGITALKDYILGLEDGICAFAGASGVGKSTLMNALFPTLSLDTGGLSEKIARGKHTTRSVNLYSMADLIGGSANAYVADTPGFSMLDFVEFDFYTLEDLPHCFPEFEKYLADCRYTDCSHTKESAADCAVVAAIERGEIAKERHESYLSIYADLYGKKPWKKKT